jgi:hypothetical protein
MDSACTNCGPDKKYWRPDCPVCKGTGVVKVKNEPMDNQLPAEMLAEIKKTAELRLIREGNTAWNRGYKTGEIDTATEYAKKLHQAEQEIGILKRAIETHKRSYAVVSDELSLANDLLESVLYLIPGTEPIHDKIQTFLDGK